jgi:hypothetical protein
VLIGSTKINICFEAKINILKNSASFKQRRWIRGLKKMLNISKKNKGAEGPF